jgi:hypothetical protein
MPVALTSLWLPILLSAIAVFVASSLVWMVLQYHNADWRPLPDEEAARRALKGVPRGEYVVPYAANNKARQSEDWQKKFREGPMFMMTVYRSGTMAMGRQLSQWFVYCLVISLLVAYVGSRTLAPGTAYLHVFQVLGTVAILAYGGSAASGAIWFGHGWGRAARDILDGVIYGLITAGMFGWLWP